MLAEIPSSHLQTATLDGRRPFAGKEASAAGSEEVALPTSGEVQEDTPTAAQVATTANKAFSLQSVGTARWTAAPESDNGMRRMLAAAAPPPVVKPSSGKWSVSLLSLRAESGVPHVLNQAP